jgi:uncharacterized protein (DUF58 family)
MKGLKSSRPLIPLLTNRGIAAISTLLSFPILGLLSDAEVDNVYYSVFLGITVVVLSLIVDWFTARRVIDTLRLSVSVPRRVYATNSSTLEIGYRARRCPYPVHCTIRPLRPLAVDSDADQLTIVITPSSRSGAATFLITPRQKGQVDLPGATVRLATGLRLFQFQAWIPFSTPGMIPVFPNPQLSKSDRLLIFRGLQTGMTPNNMTGGEGKEFDRLRPFTHGDELRMVDWKRSARRAGLSFASSLVVRVYRPETHQRIVIALDCSRLMGNLIDGRLQFDYACDAAAALTGLALSSQDEVGLLAFSHRLEKTVPARRGYRQAELIGKALIPLVPGGLEPDYDLLRTQGLALTRRSLFVVITSASGIDSLNRIGAAILPLTQKHLPLVVTIRDRGLEAMTVQSAKTADDAYVIAAAVEQQQSITRGLEALGRHGVEYLQADVTELAAAINRRYWELKTRGRL